MDEDIKHPRISVVMPLYNGEKYLREAIDSILNQTYANFELLLINDASKDSTENIILSYDDSRIIYVKNEENLGLIKTLNKGFDLSRGEFIARMDQDDISTPDRFEKQVSIFEKNSKIGVCGTLFTPFGKDGKFKTIDHPELHKDIKIHLLTACVIGHPTVMLRKDVVENLRYDENYQAAEDYELWTRLVKSTEFYNIQESLLHYRIHETNMSVLENTTQIENTKKITGNQLKHIGIDNVESNIEQCQILFGIGFKFRFTDGEFRKLVIFANNLEAQNLQKHVYDRKELHNIIHINLLRVLNRTVNKKLSTFSFLLGNRKELITKRNILTNVKMLARMIVKK